MKKIVFLFSLSCSLSIQAQNLVPNPSFEDSLACPNNLDQAYKAIGWNAVRLSPDYFNLCADSLSSPSVSIPSNFWGRQNSISGNAYAGFAARYGPGNVRECLGIALSSPLQIGITYYVSFKICLALDYKPIMCAVNKLGVRFSTQNYSVAQPVPIDNYSQVYTNSIVSDTISWTIINGSFVADSNYVYINIGNFFDDLLTDSIQIRGPVCDAYYYLDDVCVSDDSTLCDFPSDVQNILTLEKSISVYPNPVIDFLIVEDKLQTINAVKFYDIHGKLTNTSLVRNSQGYVLNCGHLSSGVYNVLIITKDSIVFNHVLIKL